MKVLGALLFTIFVFSYSNQRKSDREEENRLNSE